MTLAPSWDKVILGGTVLTMEPGSEPIVNGAIAVADGQIAAVGPAEELLDKAPTGEIVNAADCLILPGLVNTHSHLAMTLMRGMADDVPLKEWLEEFIWPAEGRHINPEAIRIGTQLAAAELLLAGVTTTADMYFFGLEVAATLAEVGMRAVVSEPLIDYPTPSSKTPEDAIAGQRELIAQFGDHPLIMPSIAAHAPYSVGAANLVKEAELADEFELPLQIHIAETRWEVEKLLAEKSMSPVAYLADLGILNERTVASHCVHISPEDMDILADFEVGVAHCPASNLKLASGLAPILAMIEHNLKLSLGTDGAASNNTLDLLRDLQLMALLQKGLSGNARVMPARAAVEMATLGGAAVLSLGDRIGTISEGRDADLICISTQPAHATPLYDPFSHLMYAARAADVLHVLVRGRVLVENRELTTIDLERIRKQATAFAAAISR